VTGGNAVEGGGIYIQGASPTLSHLLITGNKAHTCEVGDYVKEAAGGGIYMEAANPSITKVSVTGNSSEVEGGGIYMNSSDPSMNLTTVRNNTAATLGGGIYLSNSGPSLSRVVVDYNEAMDGGGLFLASFASPNLVNTVVAFNKASNEGGGLYLNNAETDLVNVTVTDNEAVIHGGAFFFKGGLLKSRNSLLSSGGSSPDEIWYSSSGSSNSMTLHYTDVAGGLDGIAINDNGTVDWGEGNLDLGHNVADDNYCQEGPCWGADEKFHPPSPIIDAGDPDSKYNDEVGLWCIYINMAERWVSNPAVFSTPDSTTARNDLGAFGGPQGSWGTKHARPGSDW